MILADKIINERKKNGWSQEELAEKLSVSRQSISKWEGAQSIPDIQKIIKMAEIFGVSTDYLLKDEIEAYESGDDTSADYGEETDQERIKVSMEEANEYLEMEEKAIPRTANMVSLCIFAPAVLIFLIALSEIPGFPFGENAMAAGGVILMLLMIATAVFFFIIDGSKMQRFEYLEKNPIETMYGVSGMVKEKKKQRESVCMAKIAIGVILCIISAIPLISTSFIEGIAEHWEVLMVSLLLVIVAIGVNLIVRGASWLGAYDKLLQEGDYSVKAKKENSLTGRIAPIYWSLITVIYLGWSFWTNDWDRTWIVWAVAGVAFCVVATICNFISSSQKNTR